MGASAAVAANLLLGSVTGSVPVADRARRLSFFLLVAHLENGRIPTGLAGRVNGGARRGRREAPILAPLAEARGAGLKAEA
jgi:hypothetical protein